MSEWGNQDPIPENKVPRNNCIHALITLGILGGIGIIWYIKVTHSHPL
jgi:hypothetical protein